MYEHLTSGVQGKPHGRKGGRTEREKGNERKKE
jgi:hypothetical protein